MVCGNFILPEVCKPCLFLSFFNLRNLLYLIRFQFEDLFGEDCRELGFEMDCAHEFEEQYPGCFNIPNEKLDTVLSDITDVDLLGSAVHSQWRYLTHWAYTYQLDEDVCNWFIKVLQRMRDLTRDITI